jgi:hypothetical protein
MSLRSRPGPFLFVFAALAPLAPLLVLACSATVLDDALPEADMKPPSLLAAAPVDEYSFLLGFDEEVAAVPSSFGIEADGGLPAPEPPEPGPRGLELSLRFQSALIAGAGYRMTGEVEDGAGNRTRFVLAFIGYNANPAPLALSELQTGKNSSARNPHRDYVELQARGDGDLGGVELSWVSGTKLCVYRFPGAKVRAGDFIVLHLAPEGIEAEKDELGEDLCLSGGVDSSPSGRDLWTEAGALADASGALALRKRPGEAAYDGLFYADEAKTGLLPPGKILDLVTELVGSGLVGVGAVQASWEDGFRWKPSTARSLCRREGSSDRAVWTVSDTGGASPGAVNPAPTGKGLAKKSRRGP